MKEYRQKFKPVNGHSPLSLFQRKMTGFAGCLIFAILMHYIARKVKIKFSPEYSYYQGKKIRIALITKMDVSFEFCTSVGILSSQALCINIDFIHVHQYNDQVLNMALQKIRDFSPSTSMDRN